MRAPTGGDVHAPAVCGDVFAPTGGDLHGLRDARCRAFRDLPLAERLKGASAGLSLSRDCGDARELHAAARYAIAQSPPIDLAGVLEVFIFTDGSAAPPLAPACSPRLGWSCVVVGRSAVGFHFLGALFHEAAGSGVVVEAGPALDSNAM